MNPEAVISDIDAVLQKHSEYRAASKYDDLSDRDELKSELLTLLSATMERVSTPGSAYRKQADFAYNQFGRTNGYIILILTGILRAIKADYSAGRLESVTELIHADLFGDFLDMADHLYSEGYKDAAAVVAGSVLEGHLRKLCEKHSMTIEVNGRPKKAESLNSELALDGIYSKLDQKSVTAWLGLRNHAAHGQYSEYTKEQVVLFIQGARDFLSRLVA